MRSYKKILKTELKLSLRGMDMLIFAVIMPIVVLVVLGIIYGNRPAFEGAGYTFIQRSFGGLASIAICAGGVMGLPLVVSDYRSKRILKRFKVTPISPVTILLVEVTIYFLYALTSLVTLFAVARIFFGFKMQGSILQFILGWLLVMVSMFSIGMMVGGIAKNSKDAGIIASILYFPMVIFSGATLPYEVMPTTMQSVVDILPLTQGIKILKSATLNLPMERVLLPIIVMTAIAVICSLVAIKFFKWE
ncbi:ABC transporter permease [Acetivibrio mesophilus]|uniref:Transport permease protein n=1 Tax=Acetivibrio mesophilus TaxID=2487273 RepID=A0A4Q0I8A3_9FIRM|nr:ABC transporter permease [Acetivibrio mesophilus]ODM26264.1 ABC transporter [Clostridium sp. Bc-iso-3]RXE60681.1 ABC transporter permease [Acetivibrio mesophilus]HHV28092.1 ABC transporter permease [Clostridium sp.]